MRPTLELLPDLLRDIRELARVELSLVRAEIGERAAGIPASVAAVALGILLLPVALSVVLVSAGLALMRLGLAPDIAFGIVAAIALLVSVILIAVGVSRLRPSRLAPKKSLSQISSLLGEVEPWA